QPGADQGADLAEDAGHPEGLEGLPHKGEAEGAEPANCVQGAEAEETGRDTEGRVSKAPQPLKSPVSYVPLSGSASPPLTLCARWSSDTNGARVAAADAVVSATTPWSGTGPREATRRPYSAFPRTRCAGRLGTPGALWSPRRFSSSALRRSS